MKMVVLVENSSRCRLCAEHGLSVYIEYEGKTYLLDTGATALFAENAKELGIDLSKVDTAFLSHAHYDHSGGFEEFFKENDKAAVYMQETSAENCFYRTEGKDKYIGIPQHLLENYKERFRPLNAVCEVEKASGSCRILPAVWMRWDAGRTCTGKSVKSLLQMILHMSRVWFLRREKDW